MRTISLLSLLVVSLVGCNGAPQPAGVVDGSLSGIVYFTAPVGGVVVTAYSYDPKTGEKGTEIARSDPTMPDGSFKVDLGIYFGPVMLEARGNGATYVEPATSQKVSWDAAQALRGVWVVRSPTNNLTFDWNRGDQQSGLIVSPFSHLAITVARASSSSTLDFTMALETALLLFHDHVEADFWSIQPTDLTAAATQAWQPPVALGLELAGLSTLSYRIATDSHTGGISTIDLFRLLDVDATDGVFDGKGPSGSLSLGICLSLCYLSGTTLRTNFADSMGMFLSSKANMSTLAAGTINDFLVRVATRHSALFPADAAPTYDVTPPIIVVIENFAVDESNLTASISGPPPGTITYAPPASGNPAFVSLSGNSANVIPSFSRYASHYGPSDPGIPTWRFRVTDDHTTEDKVDVQVRLVDDVSNTELVPWFSSAYLPGASGSMPTDYNHQVVISSALSPKLALYSGIYRLELKATDEKGNTSPVSIVKWKQTVIVPPVRQRAGDWCDSKDGQCLTHYDLSGPLNADIAITGVGIPTGALRIAHLQIDNPSSIPLRVAVTAGLPSALFSRGRKGSVNPYNNPWSTIPTYNGCQPGYELLDGSCYLPPQGGVEDVVEDVSIPFLQTAIQMTTLEGHLLGCDGNNCARDQYDIPPASTIDVWVTTPPLGFFWPKQYPLARLNGQVGPPAAIGGACEKWVEFHEPVGSSEYMPVIYPQSYWWLTRLSFRPSLDGGIRVSLVDPATPPPGPAHAVNPQKWDPSPFTVFYWNTRAPGELTF